MIVFNFFNHQLSLPIKKLDRQELTNNTNNKTV
jgi:hypothetical protein